MHDVAPPVEVKPVGHGWHVSAVREGGTLENFPMGHAVHVLGEALPTHDAPAAQAMHVLAPEREKVLSWFGGTVHGVHCAAPI